MRGGWWIGTVALLGVVAVQSSAQIVATAKPSTDAANPECPHTWGMPRRLLPLPADTGKARELRAYGDRTVRMGTDDGAVTEYEFAVPRGRTNVPEFHDCQRLLEPSAGGKRYGVLAAVFASDSLEHFFDKHEPTARLAVVALVYLPQGGRYPALGLTRRFGCLVLRRDEGNAAAWMIAVERDTDCRDATNRLASGTRLYARVVPSNGRPPSVARWHWNAATGKQEIGVRCGDFWCRVSSTPPTGPAIAPPVEFGNIGAHDEQELAESTAGGLVPGGNIGVVAPLPGLTSVASATPASGEWIPVARIHLGPASGSYTSQMNFGPNSLAPTSVNAAVLSLCRAAEVACKHEPGGGAIDMAACTATTPGTERWIARVTRIIPGRGAASKYFCVLYRPHGDMSMAIPPVVRWRWRANDETIWVACPSGCCEVNAHGLT